MTQTQGSRYQYLESLDSVRLPFRSTSDDELREITRLQIFSEILMTLVLGREVVVPQSYALDSYGFLSVARTFLEARDAAGTKTEHPFRPHLFGKDIDSIEDAISSMLSRVGDPVRPFISSAFPELNDHAAKEEPDSRRDSAWLMRREWMDDQRRAALVAVVGELGRLGRVPARPAPHVASLRQLLTTFIDPRTVAGEHVDSYRPLERDMHDRLVQSVKALDPTRSTLDQRSRLRLPVAWPGDPQGRTASEVVGGQDRLDEVIEFVDTLYNAVVAGSIGIATTTLSTDLTTNDELLAARRIAQDLAIRQYRQRPGQDPEAKEDGSMPPATMFEVRDARVGPVPLGTDATIRDAVREIYESAGKALPPLFEERGRRGSGTKRGRSQFWKGLDALRDAEATSDGKAARRALERHVRHVSRVLGRNIGLHIPDGGVVSVSLGAIGAAGTTAATVAWALPLSLQALIAGAGAATGTGAKLALEMPRRRVTRRRAAALLQIVDL